MEPRQKLFWEIKSLLLNAFANRIETNDSDGSFIAIKDSFFGWLAIPIAYWLASIVTM